jgi:hypothetical protein
MATARVGGGGAGREPSAALEELALGAPQAAKVNATAKARLVLTGS